MTVSSRLACYPALGAGVAGSNPAAPTNVFNNLRPVVSGFRAPRPHRCPHRLGFVEEIGLAGHLRSSYIPEDQTNKDRKRTLQSRAAGFALRAPAESPPYARLGESWSHRRFTGLSVSPSVPTTTRLVGGADEASTSHLKSVQKLHSLRIQHAGPRLVVRRGDLALGDSSHAPDRTRRISESRRRLV